MMAVNGNNASGRLAAGTVLWLLVTIFANQDYVYCDGEEQPQQFQPRLQPQKFLSPQLQQQQQQQQPPTQQQQSQMPPQMPSQMQPQMLQQLPQPTPPPQQQQQQQQQQRPPGQPQEPPKLLGMLGPINNMVKDMQPNINRLTGQSMNPDFGTNPPPPQLQQQPSNVANPLNMPGGGRIPMYSGSSSMGPAMQASGPLQVPTFDETNQGINPQFRLNSQSESNPNLAPLMTNPSSGQNQYRPPAQLTETNSMQGPLNNVQDSMNSPQHKYLQSMPLMQYPPNHYLSARPSMGQQRPYQPPYYPNSNMYEAPAPVNTPGFPGQSYLNMNMGDLLQPAQNMLTNLNPMEFVQKPIGMALNAVGQLGKYGGMVKNDLTRAFSEVVGKILNQGQTGMHRVFDMGLTGGNAVFDFSRGMLIPNSRNQQTGDFGVRYNSPQPSMSPGNSLNHNQQPPNHMSYMQPHAGSGQSMGVNNNGLPTPAQGAVPQFEYLQQRPVPNYSTSNSINSP